MNRLFLLLACALATPAFSQTVYKCPGPDGAVKFQQTPCPDRNGSMVMQKQKKPDPMQEQSERVENEVRSNLALFEKAKKSIGISSEEFLKERRPPDRIKTITTSGKTQEQWIYKQGYGTEYFYFENGRLIAVQN